MIEFTGNWPGHSVGDIQHCRAGYGLHYLYADHLGGINAIQRPNGALEQMRYTPFGSYRQGGPSPVTDRAFTGQKENMSLGLYYYNARYYLPGIGRFLSADTLVPDPQNPQSLNRYAYVLNSPLNFSDPTGHRPSDGCEYEGCTLPDFMNPDETWVDNSGQQYYYDPVLAKQNPANLAKRLGESLGFSELVGSTSDYGLEKLGKTGRFLPGQSGTLLVATGSLIESRSEGKSWGRSVYGASIAVVYDLVVDTIAVGGGALAALPTAETGPAAAFFGTLGFLSVQGAAITYVDPVVEEFTDQSYQQMVDMFGGLEISIYSGPGIYPAGRVVPGKGY